MKLPKLSDIGKGRLFEHKDIMGFDEGVPTDENWSAVKEEEIVSKIRNGATNLSMKDDNLKGKMMRGRDKLLNSETDIKSRVFNNQSFNMKMNFGNKKMFRGGNMNNNYSKKVESIMGNTKGASMMNYGSKVDMIMGKPSKKGGGMNVKAFDNMAKAYMGMSMGGGMKNPMQKSNMLSGKAQMPKHMNEYFGGVKKPTGNINIQAMVGMAKQKQMPRPQGNGMRDKIMGGSNNTAQNKINNMLGMPNMMGGATNVQNNAMQNMMKQPEGMAWGRVNMQKKLDLWGDADGDKVANILDCQPMNPNMQGFWGNLASTGERFVTGAKNVAVHGRTYGGYETGEGAPTRADMWAEKDIEKGRKELIEDEEPSIVKKDVSKVGGFVKEKIVVPTKEFFHRAKYGDTENIPRGQQWTDKKLRRKAEIEELKREIEESKAGSPEELVEQRKREQVLKIKELELQAEVAKAGASPKDRAKLIEAQAKLVSAQRRIGSIKGKKGKTQDIYGEIRDTTSTGFAGLGAGGFSSQGALSAFGSSGGFYQMAQPGSGMGGFAVLPQSSGMGFAQMADSRMMSSGQGAMEMIGPQASGSGFYETLGIPQPPMQEIPQPQMAQPQMEQSSMGIQESEMESDESGETMMIDGVRYNKLPSGEWKNTKTGKKVTYPRGKYDKSSE